MYKKDIYYYFFYKWRSFVFYFFFFYIYIFIFCFYFFITLISVRNVISTKNLDTYIFFIFMNIYVGTYISVTYSNLWERFFVKKIKKKKKEKEWNIVSGDPFNQD